MPEVACSSMRNIVVSERSRGTLAEWDGRGGVIGSGAHFSFTPRVMLPIKNQAEEAKQFSAGQRIGGDR